jgi:putative hydrolase of the HAD superfamily
MSAGLRALVLDFGGVISRTPFETHALTERTLGLSARTLQWMGPFEPATDPLWQQMQQGAISERDYWLKRTREVGLLVNEEWTEVATYMRRTRSAEPDAAIRPEARSAILAAKAAGFNVAVLSNELDLFYGAEFRERLDFMAAIDAVVDGTHTGVLKPDPRAYALLLERIRCRAPECVFVDDQERNIAGAAAVGMRTVHFDVRTPKISFAEALSHFGLTAD